MVRRRPARRAFALAAAGEFAPFARIRASALDEALAQHALGALKRLPAGPEARAAFEVARILAGLEP